MILPRNHTAVSNKARPSSSISASFSLYPPQSVVSIDYCVVEFCGENLVLPVWMVRSWLHARWPAWLILASPQCPD
jgi:hypothetical protein